MPSSMISIIPCPVSTAKAWQFFGLASALVSMLMVSPPGVLLPEPGVSAPVMIP